MKNILYTLAIACLVSGCGKHSEFDVTPDQVAKKHGGGPKMPDLNHLPAGAVKHEQKFKKGDTLPDGKIAEHDMKMVTVEMHGTGGAQGAQKLEGDGKGPGKLELKQLTLDSDK